MLQSGYAADFVLGLTVESLNGVRNRSASAGATGEAEPEFVRVLQLMREVQFLGRRPLSGKARPRRPDLGRGQVQGLLTGIYGDKAGRDYEEHKKAGTLDGED